MKTYTTTVTSSVNPLDTDGYNNFLIDATTGDISVNIEKNSATSVFQLRRTDDSKNVVKITSVGSGNINGSANYYLRQLSSYTVVPVTSPTGTAWSIIQSSNEDSCRFNIDSSYITTYGNSVTGGKSIDLSTVAGKSYFLVDVTSTNLTLTLPDTSVWSKISIQRIDSSSNTLTILPYSSQTINSAASSTINAKQLYTFRAYSGNWYANVNNGGLGSMPQIIYFNSGTNLSSGTYISYGTLKTIESQAQILMTRSGTLRNLNITLSAASSGSATRIFTIRVNGVNSVMTLTFTGATTNMTDITNSVSFVKGDLISISHTSTLTPTSSVVALSFELFLV